MRFKKTEPGGTARPVPPLLGIAPDVIGVVEDQVRVVLHALAAGASDDEIGLERETHFAGIRRYRYEFEGPRGLVIVFFWLDDGTGEGALTYIREIRREDWV